MKVAHFGTFDVENYGDLLFPLILERRLSDVCEEFVHVSPVGGPPPWDGCVKTVGFGQFSREPSGVDAIVVGGGQIVRATPTPLGLYDVGGVSPFLAYPVLWLGASYVAAREDLPLCWNAPGVPGEFAPVAARLVRWAVSVTDYITVRDEASRRWLGQAGVHNVDVVPDTALEVSELWTKQELDEAYENCFSRTNRGVPDRTVVCHVNSRWAGEDLAAIAARIDRICRKLGATAILVAIGPVHGDDEVQRAVAREMDTDPLLIDEPRSLREVAACIARGDAYLGSSLHGMITACSFGKRGMMVASREDAKYSGFLEHFRLTRWLAESWDEAEGRVGELLATSPEAWGSVRKAAEPVLDRHWARMRAALTRRDQATTGTPQEKSKRPKLAQLSRIGQDRYGGTEPFHAFIAESLEINRAQLQTMRQRLAMVRRHLAQERRNLGQESHKVRETRRKLEETSRNLRDARQDLRVVREELKAANIETATLVAWMEELSEGISTLSNSHWWNTGHAFAELRQKILREPDGPTAPEQLETILKQFRAWRTKRDARAKGS